MWVLKNSSPSAGTTALPTCATPAGTEERQGGKPVRQGPARAECLKRLITIHQPLVLSALMSSLHWGSLAPGWWWINQLGEECRWGAGFQDKLVCLIACFTGRSFSDCSTPFPFYYRPLSLLICFHIKFLFLPKVCLLRFRAEAGQRGAGWEGPLQPWAWVVSVSPPFARASHCGYLVICGIGVVGMGPGVRHLCNLPDVWRWAIT